MHVHGNHLNLNAPVETGAVKKSGAWERGAVLRKKLQSAATQGFDETDEDEFRVRGQQDEVAGHQQESEQDGSEERGTLEQGKLAQADDEYEALTERRTSIWA